MKKLITLALIISATTLIQAQSNLVFNQVSIIELDFDGITVPEGKVWKVESAEGNFLEVDDDLWVLSQPGSFKNMPAWFPEGTILKKSTTASGSGGSRVNRLSVLEFNVVAISSSGGGGSGSVDTGSGSSNGNLPGDDYTDGDPITDNDGNTYETVEINGQTWTTTNLNVSTYRDGTPIPYISDFDEWQLTTTGAYTYAAQDSEAGYGKLYNAFAVIGKHDNDGATPNKTLAPEGYHIPNTLEWSNLINNYMDSNYGSFRWVSGSGGFNVADDPNEWQADVASSFLKSQTSWDNNGNNESGLNIKKYPIIISSVTTINEDNFYTIVENGYERTCFAVNQIQHYTPDYFQLQGVFIGDFYLDSRRFGSGTIMTSAAFTSGGTYVRLVKDN